MTREELLSQLQAIKDDVERESLTQEWWHIEADDLLLDYINDDQVTALYNAIPMWYS